MVAFVCNKETGSVYEICRDVNQQQFKKLEENALARGNEHCVYMLNDEAIRCLYHIIHPWMR